MLPGCAGTAIDPDQEMTAHCDGSGLRDPATGGARSGLTGKDERQNPANGADTVLIRDLMRGPGTRRNRSPSFMPSFWGFSSSGSMVRAAAASAGLAREVPCSCASSDSTSSRSTRSLPHASFKKAVNPWTLEGLVKKLVHATPRQRIQRHYQGTRSELAPSEAASGSPARRKPARAIPHPFQAHRRHGFSRPPWDRSPGTRRET
jgi:hypothetical protein